MLSHCQLCCSGSGRAARDACVTFSICKMLQSRNRSPHSALSEAKSLLEPVQKPPHLNAFSTSPRKLCAKQANKPRPHFPVIAAIRGQVWLTPRDRKSGALQAQPPG